MSRCVLLLCLVLVLSAQYNAEVYSAGGAQRAVKGGKGEVAPSHRCIECSLSDASRYLVSDFRPPAYPLIVFSPEHSVWINSDLLNGDTLCFWDTNQALPMVAVLNIDGTNYRLMGDASNVYGINTTAVAQQTAVRVFPTTTEYEFLIPVINAVIIIQFFTPAFPEDVATLSLPISYITFKLDLSRSSPTQIHRYSLYFDVMGNHVSANDNDFIVWDDQSTQQQVLLSMGTSTQNYFSVIGDSVRMSWGHLYIAALDPLHRITHTAAAANASRSAFLHQNHLPPVDIRQPRAVNDENAALSLVVQFGDLRGGAQDEQTILYAYDDVQSILFFGKSYAPYWRKMFRDDVNAFLQFSLNAYQQLRQRGNFFDSDLLTRLTTAAGDKYATIGALAHRQVTGAIKIVYDPSQAVSAQDPIVFMKEISSAGEVSTTDVVFPASPFFLLLGPEVLRLTILPILQYANNETSIPYNLPWAPHNLGWWPVCAATPDQQEQMPMEETANLLLMLAALSQRQGHSVDYLQKYRPLLDSWAVYLAAALPDPANQTCTDDFEAPIPHNVNLAAKGILGLAAYSLLQQDMGDSIAAQKWMDVAQQFAGQWQKMSADGGSGGVLPHTRLEYDLPNTFSLKYNLVFQHILGVHIFDEEIISNESAFYLSTLRTFGVPLDNRAMFTKTDWLSWAAAMSYDANPQATISILNSIYSSLQSTKSRVPFTDWYDTNDASQVGFQARPVIGGIFAHLLLRHLE